MKNILMSICVAALAVCGTARAQAWTQEVKVHFSAPVAVAGTTLPAGEVTIQTVDGVSADTTLVMRSESGVAAVVLVNPVSDPPAGQANNFPAVILARKGDRYAFEQLWLSDHEGFQVLQPAETK